jgi:RNA polymerase sigma-70 factor (ECF subfamily)
VTREEPAALGLPADSAHELAERLLARAASPSEALGRAELKQRVGAALDRLPERDREVLVLRHLEELSAQEVGAVLGLSEAAVKMRALRALRRLRSLMGIEGSGGGR